MMTTRTRPMTSLRDLQALVDIIEARIALIGDSDPVRTANLQARQATLRLQIAEKAGGGAQRLPYSESE